MQLSGLLEKLQGLFTPAFLVSTVTPLCGFVFINAAILGQYSKTVDTWVRDYVSLETLPKVSILGVTFVVLLIAAAVFSTFNLGLREILEGKHLLKRFRGTEARFCKTETERLNALLNQYREIQKTRRQLSV